MTPPSIGQGSVGAPGPRAATRTARQAELHFGAHKSARVAENLQRVEAFCRAFESLPFDDAAAERYGVVRAQLQREGRLIGANDLMIASIALAGGLTLATRNLGEFTRVPGLDVERW